MPEPLKGAVQIHESVAKERRVDPSCLDLRLERAPEAPERQPYIPDLRRDLSHHGLLSKRVELAGHAVEARRDRAPRRGIGDDLGPWQEMLASRTHPRRLMTLEEMANVDAFMASDQASGMTGTTVNLTMGRLDD